MLFMKKYTQQVQKCWPSIDCPSFAQIFVRMYGPVFLLCSLKDKGHIQGLQCHQVRTHTSTGQI